MNKSKKIQGVINYLVLYLAYEYGLYLEFEKTLESVPYKRYWPHPVVVDFLHLVEKDSKRKEFFEKNKLKDLVQKRLQFFDARNDFGYQKIHLILFILVTTIQDRKQLFLDFFTDFENNFYFKPDADGSVINPGIQKILENNDDLFFKTNTFETKILLFPSSFEGLKNKILGQFFDSDFEGTMIIESLEHAISFITEYRIMHFANKEKSVLLYHVKNNLSVRLFPDVSNKEDLKFFYECIIQESSYYGNNMYL